MDGSADVSWLDKEHVEAWRKSGLRGADGGQAGPAKGPVKVEWCHERHGVVLPMPTEVEEAAMWVEVQRAQRRWNWGASANFGWCV